MRTSDTSVAHGLLRGRPGRSRFVFVTVWRIEAPIGRIWDALFDAEAWPSWWPYVERVVTLAPGDDDGLGARRCLTWRTRLPYRLSFEALVTHVEAPVRLTAAVTGDLQGAGSWTLSRDEAATAVRYDWEVQTTKGWMNRLAPLARPVFKWNHDAVMESGGKALARRLGARFLGMER